MTRTSTEASGLSSFVSPLALKIAGCVLITIATGATLLSRSLADALLLSFTGGVVAYAAVYYWVHQRLFRLRATLRCIRAHNFDEITAPSHSQKDELSVLGWEVYRTGQKLENEIQELKERESYRREFIGNVSHELKTPIFSAQGFAETLLDGALDDEEVNRTFLEKILHNVTRLENLARDLSAITKIETGELEMSSEAFDLATVFEEVYDSLELKAHENDVVLRFEVADNLSTVYGDRERIRRVLVNLADNAIKYNEEGGTVTLYARPHTADDIEIRVEDDGIGIPSDHLPRLTERFYRVDKSRSRNQGGTGLGLAIVKHILGAHDRELQVESTPGEGTTFSFTLPTTPLPALESA